MRAVTLRFEQFWEHGKGHGNCAALFFDPRCVVLHHARIVRVASGQECSPGSGAPPLDVVAIQGEARFC